MDLQKTINVEVQKKTGRNLLLIQQIEYLLKHIVIHSKISGHPSQLKDIQKTREENISKMSMGQVLSQYLNHIDPSKENNQEITHYETEQLHVSYEIDFDLSKEAFEIKENLFSVILEERNDLVHHFFRDLNKSSIKDMEHKLDEQKNRLLAALEDLKTIFQALEEGHNRSKEYSESGSFEKEFNYNVLLNDQPLILELAKISIKNVKSDGWTSLGFAGKHIRNIMPEEVNKLKDKYGYKTLKPLVENTKIFEFKEDLNKNMALYRLTADWEQHLRLFYQENNV